MLTFDHPLEAWQDPANPITGPAPGPASAIDWWIPHYRGVPDATVPDSLDGIFQLLRNAQHWWTHRPTNRYSLGYNDFLISCEGHPNDGEIIEGRGLRFRGAATGGINLICWATQIIQREGERLSPKARARCRERSIELRTVFPLGHELADHGRSPSTTVTSCAGPGIRADVDAGLLWAPLPSPEPPEEDDDMARLSYLFRLSDGAYGLRGPSGSRRVSGEELDAGLVGTREDAWPVPPGSHAEWWIIRELAAYGRHVRIEGD